MNEIGPSNELMFYWIFAFNRVADLELGAQLIHLKVLDAPKQNQQNQAHDMLWIGIRRGKEVQRGDARWQKSSEMSDTRGTMRKQQRIIE